jgi:hypothetical protein
MGMLVEEGTSIERRLLSGLDKEEERGMTGKAGEGGEAEAMGVRGAEEPEVGEGICEEAALG